jgi:hypothetical protein
MGAESTQKAFSEIAGMLVVGGGRVNSVICRRPEKKTVLPGPLMDFVSVAVSLLQLSTLTIVRRLGRSVGGCAMAAITVTASWMM